MSNLCRKCRHEPATRAKMCDRCRAAHYRAVAKWNARHREQRLTAARARCVVARQAAIAAYGAACACCGEDTYEFLTFDHVENNGAAHRRSESVNGTGIVFWARRHGYPPSLQLLCWNCNAAKQFHGTCPHARKAVAA